MRSFSLTTGGRSIAREGDLLRLLISRYGTGNSGLADVSLSTANTDTSGGVSGLELLKQSAVNDSTTAANNISIPFVSCCLGIDVQSSLHSVLGVSPNKSPH